MNRISLIILLFLPLTFIGQENNNYDSGLYIIKDTVKYLETIEESPFNELVEIKDHVPGIKLDIRYASTNNFTGQQIYPEPKAYARLPVAKALEVVNGSLNKHGLGLVVFDAYRPYSATVRFYEIYKDTNYVASPWSGSRHNRGAAVDVSIIDLETGNEIQMPTGYDDFSEAAHPDYMNLPENVLKNREILIQEMQRHGFKVYPFEWWHFDFIGWEEYDLMDLSFEQLKKVNKKNNDKK